MTTYRTLGRTGMKVSPLCLGAMMFGAIGNRDHDECIQIIDAALDAGINFIDTADVYSSGESEEIVGKALAGGKRDGVVLATKCHFPVAGGPFDPNPAPNTYGNSRRHIVKACEDSLRRLGTDRIDLYQIHRPDLSTDIDETLGALTDLVRHGKILTFGSSTYSPEQIVEAQWVAEKRHRERFQCEQPPYSIFVRSIERGVLPACETYGMGAIVWSPLNGGWLSGSYRKDSAPRTEGRAARMPQRFDASVPANQQKLELVEELAALADGMGVPLAHLAIAWTLEHPGVTSAIIGPRVMEHLSTLIGCDDIRIPVDVLDAIDRLVPPGTDVNPTEINWTAPWLQDSGRRRRPR
jgi:aryl-alcohol dehydrogenase-like predicted oxidoreductase